MEAHKIRRAVLDLQYPDEETAFRVRSQLEDVFFARIVPVLEEIFNGYEDRVLEIDRLEVDLGRIDPARFDQRQLRRAVLSQLAPFVEAPPESAPRADADGILLDSFKHFLLHGSLPWFTPVRHLKEMEEAILALRPVERLVDVIRPLLHKYEVRRRIALQFGTVLVHHILIVVDPENADAIRTIAATALPDGSQVAVNALILELAAELATNPSASFDSLHASSRLPVASTKAESRSHEIETRSVEMPEVQAPAEPVYVVLAGSVLLHPFLPRFFRTLGLLDDSGTFVFDEHRERAVHVLYHAVTGSDRPEEHETVLLKWMCGLPLSSPIARDVDLTAAERIEALALLDAVIGHWTTLRNTSPAALRETFLQREGKLTNEGRTWRLIVEQRAVDVLLTSLPWGLSVFRAPWLELPLWIDWA